MTSTRLLFAFALTSTVLAPGCKDKKTDGGSGGGGEPAAPPAKLVELDASSAGEAYTGWKLMAPEGAAAKEDFGALAVSDGKGFQLEVHSGAADIAAAKKDIESNDVNKFKRYLTDAPDALVYESDPGMGGVQVHFLAGIKVGGADFSCENTKGPIYTKPQIEAMLAACRSIKK